MNPRQLCSASRTSGRAATCKAQQATRAMTNNWVFMMIFDVGVLSGFGWMVELNLTVVAFRG